MSRSLGVKRHFIVLIWTLLCKDTLAAPSPPKSNRRCPFNKTEWEDRAVVIPCQGSDVYHCLLAQDRVSVRELCVEKSLVLKGNCPFFTNQGYLHWEPCNNTDCPNSSFVSDEVYQYRVCFGNTDHLIHENVDQRYSDEGLSVGLVVLVVLGVAVIIAVLGGLLAWIFYKRGVCGKDEDVKNGTSYLQKKNVVYICGLLGNSVSTVGKKIASEFAENEQMSAKFINYLDLYDGFEFSDKTVYFVDGWYGLWNDNPCEKTIVSQNLKLITQTSKRKDIAIKFVIGMRSDTKTFMKANGNTVPHNQTILLDSISKQKRISIKTHLEEIRGKCDKDSQDCPCKSITADEIMSIETIGSHLAIKLLELDHSLGPIMTDNDQGPLAAMKGHFKSLKKRDKDLFAGILYIVLHGFYDEHNFKTDIAKQFSIEKKKLTRKGIEKYTRRIEPANDDCTQQHILAPTWSSKISKEAMQTQSALVFWHNFLYISAFHAVYEESDDKEKFLLHCNLDAILQLVRPVGQGEYFTVEADLETISQFYEKRIKKSEFEDHVKDHPLITYLHKNTKNE